MIKMPSRSIHTHIHTKMREVFLKLRFFQTFRTFFIKCVLTYFLIIIHYRVPFLKCFQITQNIKKKGGKRVTFIVLSSFHATKQHLTGIAFFSFFFNEISYLSYKEKKIFAYCWQNSENIYSLSLSLSLSNHTTFNKTEEEDFHSLNFNK